MRRILTIIIALAALGAAAQSPLAGWWRGQVAQLPLVINISEEADGRFCGALFSPAQSSEPMPMTSLEVSGDTLRFAIDRFGINYSGVLADGNISGVFRQGMELKLTFYPATAADAELYRPQTPVPPFYYTVRNVTVEGDSVRLAATITEPWTPTVGGIVLVSGSGQQDRDETIAGHKPFAVIADYLTRCGWTVLRYDDRGVGGSSPSRPGDTTYDFADDAMAAVGYLRLLPSLKGKPVGILGHSEGGTIAIIDAARHPDSVDFIVSLAGMAVKGSDLMVRQNEMLAELHGGRLEGRERENVRKAFSAIEQTADSASLAATLRGLMMEVQHDEKVVDMSVRAMMTPWYRTFVRLDPAPYLARVKCPMLALGGTEDVQVDASMNLGAISGALPSATVKCYEGLNHLFQPVPVHSRAMDYGGITVTIDQQVLDDIADFLTTVIGK